MIRKGKGKHDLSEMFVVKNIYKNKAKNYILRQGKANFSQGSLAHDLIAVAKKYGVIPEAVFTGKEAKAKNHDHGEMEAVLGGHDAIAECAVIGVQDELKGQLPLGLVVLKDGVYIDDDELTAALIAKVREEIGAIACFNQVLIVNRLPKTRSGKILRATLRKIADKQAYTVPSTIDDPTALDELAPLLEIR